MDQPTFAELEFQGSRSGTKRKTRRELFLERMDGLVPWQRLEERIRPVYPKAGKGRRPYPLAVMLRIHCVQLFYNLSDPGVEDLLYEAESVRRFVGLKLAGDLPDETTILNFRHLLERHSLGEGLLQEINAHLESQGLRLREGTIVDASIIEAPSSTKNRAGERDPDSRLPLLASDEAASGKGTSGISGCLAMTSAPKAFYQYVTWCGTGWPACRRHQQGTAVQGGRPGPAPCGHGSGAQHEHHSGQRP